MTEVIQGGGGDDGDGPGADAAADAPGLEGIRALGYERGGVCHYLSPTTGQVVSLSPDQHTEAHLLVLRPLIWWATHYPKVGAKGAASFDLARARDDLMQACVRAGPYNAELIRGRGVWREPDGSVVVHQGDWVHRGDAAWTPSSAPFRHIYEAAAPWPRLLGEPADDDDGHQLIELLEALGWRHAFDARLLAGWLVTAPVCGALSWRPHLWLTGEGGSGKSWVIANIILPLLGPITLAAEGQTTEAGLRQALGADARPIVADEQERDRGSDAARIQRVLAFARSQSGSGATRVIKGGSSHRAQAFSGAAQIMLASINPQLGRQADEGRFSVVSLVPNGVNAADRARRFGEVKRLRRAMADDYGANLLARTVQLLPVLRANAERLAEAIARRAGVQRVGDQLGTLLAGWWLLTSSEELSAADAKEIAGEVPHDLVAEDVIERDQDRCLNALSSWCAQVEMEGGRRRVTRSIGWMVREVATAHDGAPEVHAVLKRIGLKIVTGSETGRRALAVAKSSRELDRAFSDTDFAGGYSRILERVEGAERAPTPVRFGPGVKVRAVLLPLDLFHQPERAAGGTESGSGDP